MIVQVPMPSDPIAADEGQRPSVSVYKANARDVDGVDTGIVSVRESCARHPPSVCAAWRVAV
jgi:hypothetical protein